MRHGKSPFTAAFYRHEEVAAVFYSSCTTPFHQHNTMQLVLDIQTNFRFRIKGGVWETYKTLIIGENVVHQLDTNNSVQLIIYLDKRSGIAGAIRSMYLSGAEVFSPDLNIFHLVSSHELQQALVGS
ncbi:MAG TPA: hypothetical protein VKQ08_12760, partial [Cyclobacteriaceae bacterium]|nr:hypothetical protein [Cyclobacteriaceae bacterium]